MRHSPLLQRCGIAMVCYVWMSVQAIAQPVVRELDVDTAARSVLSQTITVDLRDVTLLEALFAIRDLTGVNLVVGNEVTGTVNAAFAETPVHQVLDTLLIPRGYSYRLVSGSLAILSLESIGDRLPNFETTVIRLKANAPEDLIAIVQSLLSPEGRVHSVKNSNSLMVMDYADRIREVTAQVESLERAAVEHTQMQDVAAQAASGNQPTAINAASGTVVQVFRPQFVMAPQLSESIRPLLSPLGQVSTLENEDKLIVNDTPEVIERVAQALTQLDVPRPQVRIWALIYDCSLEDIDACGINFSSGVYGANIDAASGNPNHGAWLDAMTAPVGGPTNGVMTLSTINRLGTVNSIVQALRSSDDSRLLADPNVVVMNHEAAEIAIVTEVPYQQLTQGIDGGTIGTTEFREAGVTMTVTPHIANDNTIAIVINPRFSLLTGFTEGDNAPIIDRRETRTTVRIENLQTLVLGGLRQRTRTVEHNAIPGLSRIPYLGNLFRYKRNSARESELIVFITPEIITNGSGTPREMCLNDQLVGEIEMTPSAPRPYGIEVLRAEEAAAKREINSIHKHCGLPKCTCGHCPELKIIGGLGAE